MERVCGSCGKEPGAGSFCQHCGANVGETGGGPPAAQPQPPVQQPSAVPTPPNIVVQQGPAKRRGMFGLGCLVSVFILLALIVGGGFIGWRIFNDNVLPAIDEATAGLSDSGESPPGPCYDLVTENGFLTGWNEVSCSGSRQVEVTFGAVFNDGPFPGDEYLATEAADTCSGAFESYVGVSAEESRYEMNWLVPTEETWAEGNREGICLVVSADGTALTGTIKDSGQ